MRTVPLRSAALLACLILALSPQLHAQDMPAKPVPEAPAAAASSLDAYVGNYQMGKMLITISRDGDKLMGAAQGQPPLELVAQGPATFYVRQMDARLRFEKGADGSDQIAIDQGNKSMVAKRLP